MVKQDLDCLHVCHKDVIQLQLLGEVEVPLHVSLQQGVSVADVIKAVRSKELALGQSGPHHAPLKNSILGRTSDHLGSIMRQLRNVAAARAVSSLSLTQSDSVTYALVNLSSGECLQGVGYQN